MRDLQGFQKVPGVYFINWKKPSRGQQVLDRFFQRHSPTDKPNSTTQ